MTTCAEPFTRWRLTHAGHEEPQAARGCSTTFRSASNRLFPRRSGSNGVCFVRNLKSCSIFGTGTIGHVEDRSGVVQVDCHYLLFPGPLGAEVGEVAADLRSVPASQAGLLGPVVVAPEVAPTHQAVAVGADELHRDRPGEQHGA